MALHFTFANDTLYKMVFENQCFSNKTNRLSVPHTKSGYDQEKQWQRYKLINFIEVNQRSQTQFESAHELLFCQFLCEIDCGP